MMASSSPAGSRIGTLSFDGGSIISALSSCDSTFFFPAAAASVQTGRRTYLAGESVTITGTGYSSGQVVNLQVTHINGSAEAGGGHDPFTATADSLGNISATWQMGRDAAGNKFTLTADGAAPYNFFRGARVWVDKFDYSPGQTAAISGEGFDPEEVVTLLVLHSNGNNSGSGHTPFQVVTNSEGRISAEWYVNPDDSLDSIFRLTAIGESSKLKASSTFTDALVFVKDDAGPDDEPGQKDLNFLATDDSGANLAVSWGWDDTEWSGNNTGDACALFDNDGNGLVDFALCGTIAEDISDPMILRRYSCNDTRVDRCAGPTLLTAPTSTGTASVVPNSDPFRPGQSPAHDGSNNNCDDDDNCQTNDTVANLSVVSSEVGGATTELINVCSYPSQEPNSDPSDCVITPDQPRLKLVKAVTNDNGGTAVANDWDLSATGSSASFTEQTPAAADATFRTVTAGVQYTLSETGPTGYTASSFSCSVDGGAAVSGNTITLDFGEEAVCTITNNDIAPQLVVIKHVVNDNGGTAVASDFTLDSGGINDSPDNFAGAESPGTTVTLDAGAYNVTETGPSGYTASFSADCSGNIAIGQTKTCTVTNDDQAATLIVIKHVINDNGGTAVASDFTLDSGGANDTPDNFAGAESPGTTVTLDAGAYNVTESGPSGYTASFSADCSGNITLGQTKTCTVTNNDQAASLIVIKHVINDNGGTAVAADFTLDSGGANDSPDNFAGAESPGTTVTLDAGSYNVTESGPSGYSASFSADCSGTIANGQSKTCTVTNDDVAPQLIVIKHVVNDNGGTAVAGDFTLDSGGINDTPDNFAGAESPGTTVTLDAGAYNVTETGPSGYTASFSADCSGNIAVGQTKTCTVTNNDDAATLIVIKHVINDNGGTATAANFTLDSGGTNDSPDNFPGAESPGTSVTLDAGAYNVTESGPAGYAASFSADCSGTIANGQTKTCTVTNDDISPQLRLIKLLIPLDDAGVFDLQIDGITRVAAATHNGSTGFVNVNAGTHSVGEAAGNLSTVLSDYITTFGGDCDSSGSVTLALAQQKTCTITNTKKGKVSITKTVLGGSIPSGESFTFQLREDASTDATTGQGTTLATLTVDSTTTFPAQLNGMLEPGDYQICEFILPGYDSTIRDMVGAFVPQGAGDPQTIDNSYVCAPITVDPGDELNITIDNSPPPGGMAKTIGFWKNHASCKKSSGNQLPVLDFVLWSFGKFEFVDAADTPSSLTGLHLLDSPPYDQGIPINTVGGTLFIVDTCQEAVALLDKSRVDNGKKQASDPVFNMAAQLIAAILNIQAGADPSCIDPAIDEALKLLELYNFNGNTHLTVPKTGENSQAEMNFLAGLLDDYNNNDLTCPITVDSNP